MMSTMHPFETDLDRNPANYVPLTPVSFLTRAASAFAEKVAVIDGTRHYTYRQLLERCTRLASALAKLGIGHLDTVAIIASNIPEMIEAHFAVPMLGAVLNPLNTRLDAANIAFSLKHGSAKVLIVDGDYEPLVREALSQLDQEVIVIDIAVPGQETSPIGKFGYEEILAAADPAFDWPGITDEWQSAALLYTSGTTGDPKGVVYSHRGAYLFRLRQRPVFWPRVRQPLSMDAADVSLLRLVISVGRRGCRRHTDLSSEGGATRHIPSDRRTSGNSSVRRSDRPQYAGACSSRTTRSLQSRRFGRNRRSGSAICCLPFHGGARLPGSSPLWRDRDLRSCDIMRVPARVERTSRQRALCQDGATGRRLSDGRRCQGCRPGDSGDSAPGW